nr:hypothetical protein [Acidobacteriota bacterium]
AQAIGGGRAVTRTTGPEALAGEVRLPGTPDTPAKRAGAALLAALRDGSDAALTAFVNEKMTKEARDEFPMPEHLNALRALGGTMRSSGRVQMAPTGENEVTITFAGGETVRAIVTTDAASPHLIAAIDVKR